MHTARLHPVLTTKFRIHPSRFSDLDAGDIAVMKSYGIGTYTKQIKLVEGEIERHLKKVTELTGIKETDTGLAHPGLWDLVC